MKQGLKRRYRTFGWDFADYLMYRKFMRGNVKKVQSRVYRKTARILEKIAVRQELNQMEETADVILYTRKLPGEYDLRRNGKHMSTCCFIT